MNNNRPKFERIPNQQNISEIREVDYKIKSTTIALFYAYLEKRLGSFFLINMDNEEIKALSREFLKDFMAMGSIKGPISLEELQNIPDEIIKQYLQNKYGNNIVLDEDKSKYYSR